MAVFNKNVISEFRANDGKVDGVFEEGTMALVHHVGVKSGVERVNPRHRRSGTRLGGSSWMRFGEARRCSTLLRACA